MNGPELWSKSNQTPISPPTMKKQPGRPKKLRKLESDEVRDKETEAKRMKRIRVTMRCSNCQEENHNKRGCPHPPKDIQDENVGENEANNGPPPTPTQSTQSSQVPAVTKAPKKNSKAPTQAGGKTTSNKD